MHLSLNQLDLYMNNINTLTVYYNDKEVGKLSLNEFQVIFQYNPSWLSNGFSISPLILPLQKDVFIFDQTSTLDIWSVFIDSLPDDWGTRMLIAALLRKGIDYNKFNILEKLSLVSSISVSGLKYYPENEIIPKQQLDIDEIAKEIISNFKSLNEIKDIDTICYSGSSIGGARPKINYLENNDYWILKFPSNYDESNIGLLEYNANNTAKQSNIDVNEFKLLKSKICDGFFAAKRFDIKKGYRLHTISIAGLLNIDFKTQGSAVTYELVFQIIDQISVNKKQDKIEWFKRMVFNCLYGNRDDHCKNTSFIYDENLKGYKLSPAYDITKTPNIKYRGMLCNGKDNPDEQDFLLIAKEYHLDIKECISIINHIKEVIKQEK